ncbi:hypothetical protein D3874_13890 [Oleomonas cavernae]|uniref:Uncharacterized protein n=1 Tax=Oleomonas cavernae TaxID=2320859 RepID=A0A418WD75_9PROT|nr:hypothetical protein D3874_13890 [Oleomonas cavernae]
MPRRPGRPPRRPPPRQPRPPPRRRRPRPPTIRSWPRSATRKSTVPRWRRPTRLCPSSSPRSRWTRYFQTC